MNEKKSGYNYLDLIALLSHVSNRHKMLPGCLFKHPSATPLASALTQYLHLFN